MAIFYLVNPRTEETMHLAGNEAVGYTTLDQPGDLK
jgi:hypothetical protein